MTTDGTTAGNGRPDPDPKRQAVVDSGALDALVGCLEEFDPSVKEAAGWALGYAAHPATFDYPYRYRGFPYR